MHKSPEAIKTVLKVFHILLNISQKPKVRESKNRSVFNGLKVQRQIRSVGLFVFFHNLLVQFVLGFFLLPFFSHKYTS